MRPDPYCAALRERKNGAIKRARFVSSFLNAPKLFGAMRRNWRNKKEIRRAQA